MQRGSSGLGVVLIAVGVLFLVAQLSGFDARLGWPFFVILPGLALVLWGVVEARGPSAGLVIPGMILTSIGLLLLYQNASGHWESWAYAWALVAPTSVGLGLALLGLRRGSGGQVRAGLATAGTGLVLFLAFAAFFEGVLHISGRDFGALGSVGFPLVLVALGLAILVGRLAGRA